MSFTILFRLILIGIISLLTACQSGSDSSATAAPFAVQADSSVTVTSISDAIREDDVAGVVLTFDDRSVDHWYDYFNQKAVKATFFVSHWHTLSVLQIEKLRGLRDQGFEIASHTYDHKGINGDYGADPTRIQDYLNEQIFPSLDLMRADGFNPVSFAYPSGERDLRYEEAMRPYISYFRNTYADANRDLVESDPIFFSPGDSAHLLEGEGIDLSYGNDWAQIVAALQRAKNNNEIVTFYAHFIAAEGSAYVNHPFAVRAALLDELIRTATAMGLKFYTVRGVFEL